jgi:beta-phosphoglucomutase-like phosphatase (HAD superfamily)
LDNQYGLFWDCDGTIMDTEKLYAYAWKDHLKNLGFEIQLSDVEQFIGVDDRIVHKYFSSFVELQDFTNTMQSLGDIIKNSLSDEILFEDAFKLLISSGEIGIKSACVSASPQDLLEYKLSRANIEQNFDFIIGGDQVNRNKPYPDIYNKAIAKLGTAKNIIIEDSPTGIKSGKSSNTFVVAIDRGMFTKDDLSEADLIVEELLLENFLTIFKSL